MAIIVGTNSYLTASEFQAWADLRNKSLADYTQEQIDAALVVSAVDFIDPNFNFKGVKLDSSQAMKLPTTLVAINDIYNGAAQAAFQQLTGALFIDPTQNSAGQITSSRKKLSSLETETSYAEFSAASYTHDTTQIDNLLDPYVTSGTSGNMGKLRKC